MSAQDDLTLLLNAGRTSPPLRDAVLRVESRLAHLEEGLREIATNGYGLGVNAQEYAAALLADQDGAA